MMLSPSSHADVSGSGSPIQTQRSTAKRKRKALSCYDCRRRKLRCDREYPVCGRCSKAGLASTCSYDERSIPPNRVTSGAEPSSRNPEPIKASPAWSSSLSVAHARLVDEPEHRLPTVEANPTSGTWQLQGEVSPADKAAAQRPAIRADAEDLLDCSRPEAPTETIIFRGENFKTQYYGGSNPTSLIAHFPELRTFMREAIMHHTSLPRVQRDLKALQIKWKVEKKSVLPLLDSELLHLIPPREIVDHLVDLYFNTCETVYRIIHQPNFRKEYHKFWEDQQAASPAFIILLFLMMAAVSCISTEKGPVYIGDSAMARERAVLWIEISEWWLGRHSQKNIYLAIWQIRCLLLLAKQINIVKKKRLWTAAGTLIREAMSAGFHRDPGLLGEKVSVFDQEMRRRLWATMTELELQISIDRGMHSATAGVPSDSASVLNLNDEELGVERSSPPIPRSSADYTNCSFLHISRASFSFRVTLNALVNDLSSPSRYEEVLNYEEQVTKEIQKLPRLGSDQGRTDGKLSMMARTLLDVQLRQFLILLHAPFARQADSNSRYSLSRMICLNAAASIIERYTQLQGAEKFLLLLLRHDYFRSALNICHTMYISISIRNDLFLDSQSNTFIQYLENALVMLEERITRLGTGYTHYWYISAACSLLRSATRPEDTLIQKQQAIDRVAKQYYRILAAQEDFGTAKETILAANPSKVMPNVADGELELTATAADIPASGISYFDTTIPQTAFNQVSDLPMEEFYFGDPSAWTFDNLWGLE